MKLRSRDLKLYYEKTFYSSLLFMFFYVFKKCPFWCALFSVYFVYATDKYDSVIYI